MPPDESSTRTSRMLAWVVAGVLRRRSASLLALALLLVLALLGLTRLRVDFSSTTFYGDGSQQAQRLEQFHERWGADDSSLAVLVHTRDEADGAGVLTPDRLQTIDTLSRALVELPEVAAVQSIASMTLPELFGDGGPTRFAALAEQLGLAEQRPAARAQLLEQLPFVPTLLSADGRDALILVELGHSSDDMVRTKASVDAIDALLRAHEPALAELGLSHELAGVPAIRAAFFELLVRDQLVFVPLTLMIIALSLLWVFRRLHGVLIPALAAMVPTAMLVGIMGWVGEPLGLLNQAYFTLLPVIAVADAIHMLARYHEQRRADSSTDVEARTRAIVQACSRVGLACLLTSLTTGAGFASLLLADMPIMRSFGLFAALGVGLAFVVGVVLVPVLLSFVRDDRLPLASPGLHAIDVVVAASLRRPASVLIVATVLMGLALIPAARVRVDNTLSNLLDASHPVSVASRRVDAQLGGVLGLEIELLARDDAQLRTPELLTTVAGFETWLRAQPEVRAVDGLASAVAQLGLLRDGELTIAQDQAKIDARIEWLAAHAPLTRMLTDDGRALRIHAGMPDAGGQQFVAFAERVAQELEQRLTAAGLSGRVEAQVTGTALLAYRGVNGITDDLRTSFVLVFVVVVGVIALAFRSVWPAMVAILPNLAPLLIGYSTLGLLDRVLDPLAGVILTLALGIAVDDTLHVMVRTREALREGDDLDHALRAAIRHSGWAVAVTSIVVAAGLLLNLGSSFPPLSLLGLLGSLVIALALVANLTLLPATLALLRGRGLRGG